MSERFLVTGALGCIGAWTVAALVREGVPVVGFDLGTDTGRLRLIMSDEELDAVTIVRGDLTDRAALDRALDEHGVSHVVHLAALLIPLIKADPPRGTAVNVVGTTHVLDAAKTRGLAVAYASSAAVFSAADPSPVRADADGHPTTFYGVHKLACEGLARIFWTEEGVASVGLRPFIVYGPGRDVGLTAAPSLAMAAAARGEPAHIAFGGRTQLQFAPDVGRMFVAAARAATEGARVFNVGGPVEHVRDCIAAIEAAVPELAGRITFDDAPLQFPEEFEGESLERALGPLVRTPLAEGVRATIETYREAASEQAPGGRSG